MATKVTVDLQSFPPELHRLVLDWYRWQEATLRGIRQKPGGTVVPDATPEFSFWLANPPRVADNELLLEIGDIKYYLSVEAEQWSITKRERNNRSPVAQLLRLDDAEKYLLCVMGDAAWATDPANSPSSRWYDQGLAPRTRLVPVDPDAEFSRQFLFVDDERMPRATMRTMSATWFSHPLLLTYEQVGATYREGLPPDRFTIEIVPT
ncbi:hypothetical protein ACIP5Y_42275 [Nocardia sp. NPDC088792]|uniref:hypothetical protein n=1 Tax=Nocardia sp. NPDC088792 TaxID=3364332 RepID=UPI003815FFA2